MKCIEVQPGVDLCVSVDVKLIYKVAGTGDIRQELIRNDAIRMAKHRGARFEEEIVRKVGEEMAGQDLGLPASGP
jgi:hypothetical protein